MSDKQYREFLYLSKEDYDKKLKINGDELLVYSKKKLKDLYPEKDYEIIGETFEKKKRNKEKDIGKIELNDKLLYVGENGKHNKLFKKPSAFVEVDGGGFVVLLKTRLLPIILIGVLLLCLISGGLWMIFGNRGEDPGGDDVDIKPIDSVVLTITGIVTKDGKPVENAKLSLQYGNEEIATATTDAEGKYLINDVKNGNYNLVCTNGDSILTKLASVFGESIVVNFTFPSDDLHDVEDITDHHDKEDLPDIEPTNENTDVKAIVKITDGKTPPVAVNGLSEEAILHMIAGKEVDLTLFATLLEGDSIPKTDKAEIEALAGQLEMTYYDFSILKEIFKDKQLESSEYLKNTKTVLEIAVPFDSSHSVATYVFRYHSDTASKLDELTEKPIGNYTDGTCYITNSTVYIYTDCFSTYAIGAANTDQIVRGSDTITYSDTATVNLKMGNITLLYKHDADSTNNAKIEIYLVGTNGNLLIAESATIPVGYQIERVKLKDNIQNMPSVGTYEGLMKIIYLDSNGAANTNVEIPLKVAITK